MLRKINKWIFVLAGITLVCALFFVSQKSSMQKQEIREAKTDDTLPEGNWSVSFHPYLKDGYKDSPVYVASVANKDTAVTSFEVFNNSPKDVKAFRLKWLVYAGDNSQKAIKEGKTPYVRLFNKLVSGKGGKIKYSAISLRKFYESFVENGRLDKDFQVDLLVDEVKFTDGSNWKSGDGKPNFVNAKFEKPAKPLTSSKLLTPCSQTRCKSVPNTDIKGGVTYTCEPSTVRETCSNAGDQYSCNNIACDRPGGGGSGDFGWWDDEEYELEYSDF